MNLASSTGLAFTHRTIVDAHFRACEPTYLNLLEHSGLRPGWHVLDAGCGAGNFLPHLVSTVGPDGKVSAVDLAEEHVTAVAASYPVEVRQGSVLALPYDDDTFDAVWCANTTQYLDDRDLATALAEFARVVRPGGIVAVKDLDAHLITARPGDPFLFTDYFRAAAEVPGYARQLLRSRDLYRHLRRAGLVDVRQRTVLIEHHAPLSAAAREFYPAACAQFAPKALELGLSAQWQRYLDPDADDHPLNGPDGYICEGNVLAVGRVPGASPTVPTTG
ncbi:methyltransferase family protein [Saccharothrix carnea]|uniref:Methyltransferase family protein n=1 Tax=Saccharothrix carnea TaxID=1280637 RepID=A0A2P8HR01_SACCR|nr:class I SAM-dependent methyltransferase [Saccharothrix carnea]PSL48645.1 methyltransferase family protein [Saccharothrix carnea]